MQNKIKANQYDNKSLLAEAKILFPEIQNLSMANHAFISQKDSTTVVPVLLYQSKDALSKDSKEKLGLWLKQKLSKDKIEIYKQE